MSKIEKFAWGRGKYSISFNMMSQRTEIRHALHIPVPNWSLSVFIFGNFPAKPPFLKRLSLNHTQFLWKGSHSKYPQWLTRKIDSWSITCNNSDITKRNSVPKIFSRSGFSTVNSLAGQNGYRALPHWFAQLYIVQGYWSLSDGDSYFANHIRPYLVMCLSKSCMPTLDLEFIQTWSATYRSLSTERSTASTLFTVTSSPVHVIHLTTIKTRLSFSEVRNLYCPWTRHFS